MSAKDDKVLEIGHTTCAAFTGQAGEQEDLGDRLAHAGVFSQMTDSEPAVWSWSKGSASLGREK